MTAENIIIRKADAGDAALLLPLLNRLDEESDFRAYEPGERKTNALQLAEYIEDLEGTILIAEVNGRPAGYLEAERGRYNRNRHSAHINLAVLKEFQGTGIGRRLFEVIEQWAGSEGIHRLDLCVFTYNLNAVKLYLKMGFEIEGTKKSSFFVNGKYVDEYIMAKLIP